MSERFYENTPFYSSLKEYFKNDSRYSSIEYIAQNKPLIIKDKKKAKELFGKDMYISASRIEDFYNCPFRYFCKFGLSAKKRTKAEIDPMQRGTLIHFVLEMILSDVGTKKLSTLDYAQIKELVDKYINKYFEDKMSLIKGQNKHFDYNFKRLSKLVYDVVMHLSNEFKNCDFEAKAFELSIDKDGEVKPQSLPLESGGSIQIRGSIDRVDVYDFNGEKYVRVIDYKSGVKKFKLSDILDGLNLQMFVYLFALCDDKNAALNGVPAGVLYMHAARNILNFNSPIEAKNNLENKKESRFKMNGIVLSDNDNAIAKAMEHELEGKYIPVSASTKGVKGDLITLEHLGLLHKKVNSLVKKMGNELQNGVIERAPIKNSTHLNTCDYCDYSDICANTKAIYNKIGANLKDEQVIESLHKEFENDAGMDNTTE